METWNHKYDAGTAFLTPGHYCRTRYSGQARACSNTMCYKWPIKLTITVWGPVRQTSTVLNIIMCWSTTSDYHCRLIYSLCAMNIKVTLVISCPIVHLMMQLLLSLTHVIIFSSQLTMVRWMISFYSPRYSSQAKPHPRAQWISLKTIV